MIAPQAMQPPERLPRKWLPLARGAWIVCALLLLANFVASIPAYYRLLTAICTLPKQVSCANTTGQLSPANVHILAQQHLSLSAYAALVVTLDVLVSLLAWGIALLIFWRKSAEGMGLFVSLLLVLFGGTGNFNSLLGTWAPSQPSPLLSNLFSLVSGMVWIGLGAFLLTFPTGRFAPRWSWLVFTCWIISFVGTSLPPLSGVLGLLESLAGLTGFLAFGGTLFIMVYRYVRLSNAIQRQQTKWFVSAAVVSLLLFILGTSLPGVVPAESPSQLLFPLILLFSSALIYLGLGIAILRYRLWDIDAIINRTLVYGSLTALLALLYFGLIFALQTLFQGFFKQDNAVAIVVSTLVIFALFRPLRLRLQRVIDRRFYRSKYDATRTLAQFSARLRNEVDLQQLQVNLVAVVEETMQPMHVSLWLRPASRESAAITSEM